MVLHQWPMWCMAEITEAVGSPGTCNLSTLAAKPWMPAWPVWWLVAYRLTFVAAIMPRNACICTRSALKANRYQYHVGAFYLTGKPTIQVTSIDENIEAAASLLAHVAFAGSTLSRAQTLMTQADAAVVAPAMAASILAMRTSTIAASLDPSVAEAVSRQIASLGTDAAIGIVDQAMVDRVNAALAAASDRVQNHIYDLLYPGSASVSGDVNYGWMIRL
jgi:hypothetical protein